MTNKGWVGFAVVVALQSAAFAKMYETPRSFALKDKSQEQVQRKVLPKIDTARLIAEDKERGKNRRQPTPRRFAVAADVSYTLDTSGSWQTLPDGRLWRLRIQSPGAVSMNLGITRFDMPDRTKLWIYDPSHKDVEGPYTAKNRSHLGSLWTPVVQGDEIIVEIFVPSGAGTPVIEIQKVNQGYQSIVKSGLFGVSEGTCENDVVCPVGNPWSNQIRAVGVYTRSGLYGCTGTLVNNTAHDFKNYFLSANHCGVDATNDATVVVYWNDQSATCGTHGPGSTSDNQTGSTFRASYAPSDFQLIELSSAPDSAANVYYVGWDASGSIPSSTVDIHQPELDVKAISFSNSAPDTTAYYSPTHDPSGNHWYVLWNSGVTEEGSSGSCLFETTNQRCIGQLHGGPSACGGADLHDYFGRLSVSWNGGGTAATRLKDWLDPGSTGALTLDGDPHINTDNGVRYDFQSAGEFISLRDPDGLEIQTRQTAISTTFNPGPDQHDGLATCVSINTAVAARVGKHRVSYENNVSGVPDPSGLQLRVDGTITTLPGGIMAFPDGGSIVRTSTPGGLAITFPDDEVLFVTPAWWGDQGYWYLNVDVTRPPGNYGTDGGRPGAFPRGGIAGSITGDNWLPALPDGSSMGGMPQNMHDRYVALYQKFADAWRVTSKDSLFDYAPGTSTETFTMRSWPKEQPPCVLPERKPAKPATEEVAVAACRPVTDEGVRKICVFDVMVTGNVGFAKTYIAGQKIRAGLTMTTLIDEHNPTIEHKQPASFVAVVARLQGGKGVPTGTVQFMVDGKKVEKPIKLNPKGQAMWRDDKLESGVHHVMAVYEPAKGSEFVASTSRVVRHHVRDERGNEREEPKEEQREEKERKQ
jgi:V8-like Glu-specific endopeptidase